MSKTGWTLLNEEEARREWNRELSGFADGSPFQSYEWGEFQRGLGWRPLHLVCREDDGGVGAMALVLLKRSVGKAGIAWVTGGPVGRTEYWTGDLPRTLMKVCGLRFLYFRFRCDRPRTGRDALLLRHMDWTRPLHPMGSNFTMELDLTAGAEEITAGFSKKWRRNLRLALKNELVIRPVLDPDVDELRRAFAEMERNKDLPELFSEEKLRNLFRHAGPRLILHRCEDSEGRLLAFRTALREGARAVDYLAVTGDRGRRLRASFPLLREMLLECREQGVRHYDLGGIDPYANPGVHTFKRGTGAAEIEHLGEWDWASHFWLRAAGNWVLRKRENARATKTVSGRQGRPGLLEKACAPAVRLVRAATVRQGN